MTIPHTPRSTEYLSGPKPVQEKTLIQKKIVKETIGLPMQYVAEDELDKIAGSIRIKL